MRTRIWLLVCLSLLVSLVWIGCGNVWDAKLAVVAPLTGPQAKVGQEVLNGVTLAAEEWNAAGGVRGKKIKVISADDQDNPTKAAEVATSIAKKAPLVVIGHVDSSCSLAASKVYKEYRIVMISPASTNPKLTDQGFDNVHRICGRDDHQGKEAAVWCVKYAMGKKVAVLHDDTDYGRGLAEEFKKNLEFLSNQKVIMDEEVPRGVAVTPSVIEKVAAAAPGLVFFGGLDSQAAALLKGLRQSGVTAFFMSGDGCFTQEFISLANPVLAQGALVTFYPDLSTVPGTKANAFAGAYAKRFGSPPGPNSIYGYSAAVVALTAIANAVTPVTDRTVEQALHRLTFETPAGFITLDEKGDPRDFRYTVWRVDDGKFVEIGS